MDKKKLPPKPEKLLPSYLEKKAPLPPTQPSQPSPATPPITPSPPAAPTATPPITPSPPAASSSIASVGLSPKPSVKNPFNKKTWLIILLVFLTLASIVGGIYLAQQKTAIKPKAADNPEDCAAEGYTWCEGNSCPDGWSYGPGCWTGGSCDARDEEACRDHQSGGGGGCSGCPGDTCESGGACIASGGHACNGTTRYTCDPSKPCGQQWINPEPDHADCGGGGGNGGGSSNGGCNSNLGYNNCDNLCSSSNAGSINGLCDCCCVNNNPCVYQKNSSGDCVGPTYTPGEEWFCGIGITNGVSFNCAGGYYTDSACTSTGGSSSCNCGTSSCNSDKSWCGSTTPTPTSTPTPTPTPTSYECECSKIILYGQDWEEIQPTDIIAGQIIYIAISGSEGYLDYEFDKGRIRVNSSVWSESNVTETLVPRTNDQFQFYITYLIPTDGGTFVIEGEIHLNATINDPEGTGWWR